MDLFDGEKVLSTNDFSSELEAALRDGYEIECTLTGAGLRKAIIQNQMSGIVAHARSATVDEALAQVARNYRTRESSYEQYGPEGVHVNWMLGSADTSSGLDECIVQGGIMRASLTEDKLVVMITGTKEAPTNLLEITQDVIDSGATVYTEERGVLYKTKPTQYGKNEVGAVTEAIDVPANVNPWLVKFIQTGTGNDFQTATKNALQSEKLEHDLSYNDLLFKSPSEF